MRLEPMNLEGEKELAFPVEEYRKRLAAIKAGMANAGLDLLVVHTPENILYLTGYRTPGYYMYQCLLIGAGDGEPLLLIRNGEVGNARLYSWLRDCQTYFDGDDAAECTDLAIATITATPTHIGLEMKAWFFTISVYEDLRRKRPAAQWVDASGTVEACRLIKSPLEIGYIRQAARATEAGMRAAIDATAAGKTDNDVAAALHFGMIEAGSEYPSMGPFVASGKRATIMHGIWGRNRIESGQTMNLEVGAVVERYNAGLMRSVSIGKPSQEVQDMADAVESANRKLIDNVAPGAMTADLHQIVSDELEARGFGGSRKGRRCGYSIGLAFPPDWGEGHILSMIDRPNSRLEAGMVFHLPLSVRKYPRCATAFSETVLVTDTGHEILTNFERRLFVK